MTKLATFLCAFCLGISALQAQSGMNDRVFLKNGSIIRGAILEMIPDSTVKIHTSDGSLFVFRVSEIEKIIPGPVAGKSVEDRRSRQGSVPETEPIDFRKYFCLSGGIGIPIGDLSKDQSAKTGFLIGARYVSAGTVGWMCEGTYFRNSIDLPSYPDQGVLSNSDAWTAFSIALGLKFELGTGGASRITLSPLVGVLFSTFPAQKMTLTDGVSVDFGQGEYIYAQNIILAEAATSATSFLYGVAFDVLIADRISMGARYIGSTPEYNVEQSVSGTGTIPGGTSVSIYPPVTGEGRAKLNTSFLMFDIGIVF